MCAKIKRRYAEKFVNPGKHFLLDCIRPTKINFRIRIYEEIPISRKRTNKNRFKSWPKKKYFSATSYSRLWKKKKLRKKKIFRLHFYARKRIFFWFAFVRRMTATETFVAIFSNLPTLAWGAEKKIVIYMC